MLSELMELALALASGFQALGVAALKAGDLDRGGDAETCFSSLFLGIRRAIALKMKLREQREQAQRQAQVAKDRLQAEKDDRRQAVARGVAQAIAAAPDTEAQERLTADLWEKLTEDERIDVDLADTALPIEALIASLCRALGLPPRGTPPAGGSTAAAKAGTNGAGAGPKGQASGPVPHRTSSNHRQGIPAEDARRARGTTGRPPAPGHPPRLRPATGGNGTTPTGPDTAAARPSTTPDVTRRCPPTSVATADRRTGRRGRKAMRVAGPLPSPAPSP